MYFFNPTLSHTTLNDPKATKILVANGLSLEAMSAFIID